MSGVTSCVLVPIHDHGDLVGEVIADLAPAGVPCLVVDDGSGAPTRAALDGLERKFPFVEVLRRERNGGKGAALKTGYRAAARRGFTHAVQIDADGQHDAGDVPRFLEAICERPDALVLGVPVFDETVPRTRLAARQISRVLVWLACLSRCVPDPLCGFRGIPLAPTLRILDAEPTGDHMEFEPELAVRLVWAGVPVACIPTRVVYRDEAFSHFSLRRDYPLLAAVYARLVGGMLAGRARGRHRPAAEAPGSHRP